MPKVNPHRLTILQSKSRIKYNAPIPPTKEFKKVVEQYKKSNEAPVVKMDKRELDWEKIRVWAGR